MKDAPLLYLHPGRAAAVAGRARVTTILGSGVALCLFDRAEGIGGVSHFVLPSGGGTSPREAGAALEALLAALERLGADRSSVRAKLYGGAWPRATYAGAPPLGLRNVEAARALLERHGIPLVEEDTGDTCGRRLTFRTDDGAADLSVLRGETGGDASAGP